MGAPVRVACLASAMTVGAKALVKLTHLARNVNDVLVVASGGGDGELHDRQQRVKLHPAFVQLTVGVGGARK